MGLLLLFPFCSPFLPLSWLQLICFVLLVLWIFIFFSRFDFFFAADSSWSFLLPTSLATVSIVSFVRFPGLSVGGTRSTTLIVSRLLFGLIVSRIVKHAIYRPVVSCPAVRVLSISILTALFSSENKHATIFSAFVDRLSDCESLITRLASSAADEAVSCCCSRLSLPTKLDFIGVRPSDELSMIMGLWAVPLLHMNSSSSSILSWVVCRATSFCGSLSHELIPGVFCVVEWANFPSPQTSDGFCLKFSKGQF